MYGDRSRSRIQRIPATVRSPEIRRAYASFATGIDAVASAAVKEFRRRIQSVMHEEAAKLAQKHGDIITSTIIEGRKTQAILEFLREQIL